jgi:hypothetical protein
MRYGDIAFVNGGTIEEVAKGTNLKEFIVCRELLSPYIVIPASSLLSSCRNLGFIL